MGLDSQLKTQYNAFALYCLPARLSPPLISLTLDTNQPRPSQLLCVKSQHLRSSISLLIRHDPFSCLRILQIAIEMGMSKRPEFHMWTSPTNLVREICDKRRLNFSTILHSAGRSPPLVLWNCGASRPRLSGVAHFVHIRNVESSAIVNHFGGRRCETQPSSR